MAVYTFLESYDWDGKTLIPFNQCQRRLWQKPVRTGGERGRSFDSGWDLLHRA